MLVAVASPAYRQSPSDRKLLGFLILNTRTNVNFESRKHQIRIRPNFEASRAVAYTEHTEQSQNTKATRM